MILRSIAIDRTSPSRRSSSRSMGNVDFAAIKGVEKIVRIVEPNLDGKRGVMGIQPHQQCRQFGAADIGG